MTNDARISPEAADEAVHRALALFIGRGRQLSVEDAATGTGIPARTIYAWLAADAVERRRPSACHLLIVAQFIGVEFTNKLLGAIGQGGRLLEAEPGSPGYVIAKLASGTARFAELGGDGAFDHIDCGKLEAVADEMILIATPFSSRGHID